MKKTILTIAIAFAAISLKAQSFMQITTIESVVPGGMGRSKMIITKEDGSQIEKSMENFYSMVGINFGNIKSNEQAIVTELGSYLKNGWVLLSTSTGVQSADKGPGIFVTRYFLEKK